MNENRACIARKLFHPHLCFAAIKEGGILQIRGLCKTSQISERNEHEY